VDFHFAKPHPHPNPLSRVGFWESIHLTPIYGHRKDTDSHILGWVEAQRKNLPLKAPTLPLLGGGGEQLHLFLAANTPLVGATLAVAPTRKRTSFKMSAATTNPF
jgi:hypothetical protein